MRSAVSVSKLALLTQSAPSVGIARRTREANLKRNSRSSCTIKHRPESRLIAPIVDSRRSVLAESLFIGRFSLFRQAKCNSQFRANRDGFPALRHRLVAQVR